MGRPVSRNLEDELMTKIKLLFDGILDSVNKENPSYTFDFEQFVDCFDVNDHFFKRIFEFLVKETALRHRSLHPYSAHPPFPRPHTIHHIAGERSNITNSANTDANEISAAQSPHRHHNHHQAQRLSQLSRHALPTLERDSSPRPPSRTSDSSAPTEGPSSGGSSGAALRYLLANQGFSQSGSRRSRMAHRLLSNDLLAYQQGQPSLLSTVGAMTSPAASAEATNAQNRGLGQSRTRQEPELANGSGSIASPADTSDSISTPSSETAATFTATSTAASLIRSLRRGDTLERQRAFIYRPHSRSEIPSMESAPGSFGADDWSASPSGAAFASEVFDPVASELYSARPSSPERRLLERHIQEQLHSQELRQQQIRQFYIQTLQARGRPRQLPLTQLEQTQLEQTQQQRRHAFRTLQGERSRSSEDVQQQQPQHPQEQQQQQPQYPLRDNGLMLVQLYPTSPSTPAPALSMTPEGTADGGASHSTSTPSTLDSMDGPLEERYREFSDSTQRGRAAMRTALAETLQIEEDHQVLLTGERHHQPITA